MRFTVPQFIEYEAKIVGPLTFRQFVYVGIAGAICFTLYFLAPFYVFLISCFFLGGLSLALSFLKIGGRTLPTVFGNLLRFSLSSKIYIWKKTEAPLMVFEKEVRKKEVTPDKETLPLKIAEGSQLKKLRTQLETKTK